MADVSFSVVAHDFASRTLKGIGRSALEMAAMVNAANASMADGWARNTQLARGWFNAILYGAPLVPPALGAIVGAVGALNSVIMSATPGIGALGGALFLLGRDYSQMSQKISAAQKSVDNTQPGTAAHKQAVAQLESLKAQSTQGTFGEGFTELGKTQGAIQQFGQNTQATTVPISITAFQALQDLLPKLQPVVHSFGEVFNQALQKVKNGINSPGFDKFLTWVQQVGLVNFNNLLKTFGNLSVMLANLGMAFSSQGMTFTKWLADTTAKWKTWSATLDSNKGFQKFLDYMRENGPMLGRVLGNLAKFVGDFVVALGPLGHIELKALETFTGLLAKIPPNVMGPLATGIMAVVTAAKVLAAVQAVVTAATVAWSAVTTAAAAVQAFLRGSLLATRIGLIGLAVAQGVVRVATLAWTAVQWLLNAALTANPIGLVIVAIAAFVAAIIFAYKHSETFRNAVNAVGHALVQAFQWGLGKAKEFIGWLTGSFFPVVARGWQVVSADFQRGLGVVSRVFWSLWNAVIKPVIDLILKAFATMMRTWGTMLQALSHVPGFGWAKAAADAMFGAANAADRLRGKIDALHSKSITVSTTFKTTTIKSIIEHHSSDSGKQPGSFNPNPGYAAGGPTPAFRDFVVGEDGPEVLRLPVPAQVYNRAQVKSMVQDHRQLGGGGTSYHGSDDDAVPIELHVHLEGQTIVKSVLAYKRNRGGGSLGIA